MSINGIWILWNLFLYSRYDSEMLIQPGRPVQMGVPFGRSRTCFAMLATRIACWPGAEFMYMTSICRTITTTSHSNESGSAKSTVMVER